VNLIYKQDQNAISQFMGLLPQVKEDLLGFGSDDIISEMVACCDFLLIEIERLEAAYDRVC